MRRNIFVVGLDDFNLRFLRTVRHAETYEFRTLLDYREIAAAEDFDFPALLAKAERTLRRFDGTVDAIVGYWDFPATLMLPILRRRLGLRGPSLESVLRCEHKYWSRLEQSAVVPAHVPRFALVDPFDAEARRSIDLPYPFWIKPVKAHSSKLGFEVRDERDLTHALAEIRKGIRHFSEPFNAILEHARLPDAIARVGGEYCIAEEIISAGRQCTLEGYVLDGDVEVYGVVDSIRGPNRSSFERYEYPSTLPGSVQSRMKDIARTVIERVGLDDSPFNIEMYFDESPDSIHLLEINARISKSHCPLFEKVEGTSHQEVMIDVALGRRPEYPLEEGRFPIAAKLMLRRYGIDDDLVVSTAPTAAQARALERRVPGAEIALLAREGMKLGEIRHKDSYSYELATLFLGADSEADLARKHEECLKVLHFEFTRQNDERADLSGRAAATRP